jgi:hypothetical protein
MSNEKCVSEYLADVFTKSCGSSIPLAIEILSSLFLREIDALTLHGISIAIVTPLPAGIALTTEIAECVVASNERLFGSGIRYH